MAKDNTPSVKELIDEWTLEKAWVNGFTRDFPELSNLADAVALSRTKGAPMVGDVTLATSVRQIPRASIQQIPVFSVEINGTKQSVNALIGDYIVRRIVFSQDTFGKGILSTLQIGAESALTLGFQAAIAVTGSGNNDFSTSMKLIHWNDIAIERGIFDANESEGHKVRTRVTKSRLRKIRDAAKANPDTTWNVKAINELLDLGPATDVNEGYDSTPRYTSATVRATENQFDIITCYKTGPYGDVTVFAPNSETALRTFKSKSKFGYPRVSFLVIDPAQLTPFGVSRVRLASPAANYANIYLQSTAKMQLLNADPPVFQKGQFTTPVRMKRGALWQAIDPNADVKLQELSNSTLNQFRTVLEFVDNQIYGIMGVTSGSSSGNGAAERTDPKLEAQTRTLSTTQITNILENFLRQYALTALDLFVSEQTDGPDAEQADAETAPQDVPLIIDDQCKNAINKLAENKFVPTLDPMTGMPTPFVPPVGDDNTVMVNWDEFYDGVQTWTVDIDLSMSKDTLEEKKRADLQDMLTVMSQTANPNDPTAAMRIRDLENTLLEQTIPEAKRTDVSAAPAPMMPPGAAPGAPAPAQSAPPQ
jgi:hypothetical protein